MTVMPGMRIRTDPDIEKVLEFMDRNIACDRMVGVAAGLHAIAPLLWGRYEQKPVQTLSPVDDPDPPDALHTRSVPSESRPD